MHHRAPSTKPIIMHTSAKRADVARRAKVSEATVTRSLNDSPLLPLSTKIRVRQIAEEMGYIPNKQAGLFARKKTFKLGFVVRSYKSFPPFSRSYFPALLDGAVLGAESRGYSIVIILDKHENTYKDLGRIVLSKEVDGLLISVIPINDERLLDLKKKQIPLVLINNYKKEFNCVDANPRKGIEKALLHARETGHIQVGYITGDMAFFNARDRAEAVAELAHKLKISVVNEEGDFSRRSGYICSGKLLQNKNRPTLIMTTSDRQALGVYDYCRDHRLTIPDDVSVIGFDNFDPAKDLSPALSTINNPVTEAGATGAKLLIDMIQGKETKTVTRWLDTDFVVRRSTGPCPKR